MKRALAIALVAFLLGRGAHAQTVTARVGGDLTGFTSSWLVVPVAVDMSQAAGATLGSYTARLSWNPSVLNCYDYYYQCAQLVGNFPPPQINTDSVAQGVLRFAAISPSGVGELVTLAQFRFLITDTTTSSVNLSFSEMSAAGSFTNLLPSLNVTSGTFCTARGRWGDLDGDTRANSRDALAILSAVVGLAVDTTMFRLSLGDVDGDVRADSRDALIVLSYAVGLDVPGQRVLLPAPRGCAGSSPRRLTMFPSVADIAPNQPLQLFVQAVDSVGNASAVPDPLWRSSDYTIAAVDPSGLVTPRAVGTATITVEAAPGLRATATITVLSRRPNWYVDLRATGAPLQLGTAAAPFEHPAQAFAVVGEGDTIRVAAGTYDFTDTGALSVGAVIIGGTPGDTTTRPVFRDLFNDNTALRLTGGFRTVVRNVVLRDFYYGVDLDGVRNFAIEDSRVYYSAGAYGDGIYVSGYSAIDTLRSDRTVFLGDSTGPYYSHDGTGINTAYDPQRVGFLLVRDSEIRYFYDGLVLTDVDSAVIQRSVVSDNSDNGIETYQEYAVLTALHVTQSRIERNYYEGIYADYVRRLIVDTTVVRATYDDAIYVYGDCCSPTAQVYLRGDSIYQEWDAEGYEWLDADYVDSLVIDNTVVRYPADTSFYAYTYIYADKAFVTNSKFLNIESSSEPFYFYGSQALFDNVDFAGCNVAGCDGGYGPELYGDPGVLNATIQNSRFSKLGYAAYVYDGGVHRLVGNTVDSTINGFYTYGDSIVVSDNVLTRVVARGIVAQDWSPARTSSVLRNSVTCTPYPSTQRGLEVTAGLFVVATDTVTNCRQGVYLSNVEAGTVVQGTIVRNPVHGIWSNQPDSATVRVLNNAISGADTTAVYVVAGRVWLQGNNIRNNELDGLSIPFTTGYVSHADGNAFVGNARYAVNTATDSVDAAGNFWGTDGSGSPGSGGTDNVLGRVATSGYLTSEPGGLPGLAPLIASAPRPVPSVSTAVAVELPTRLRAPHAVKTARTPRALPAGLSAPTLQRIERTRERRAAREAQDAERRRAHDAQRVTRQIPR